ncbi:MAG: 3-oxoacyl-ACP synthase [Sulfobacillus thermosulfidooxidans]|uniref:Beta-ketoacyl-[acyl-carrier-protein] synthase III n=1 Tax=Sulfobacillus thermotolerans TaxID=338644 RepID=A0ABN5H1B4_9FIRM|nr:3-oxoacyl-ACP synthase [Sulfobacillus thermotolerans]MCY0908058.1 ketoacyl-ACP synthase III [Sulfobacillus thermotolerans]PSR36902.1 MAG: 3-oxoacyl-ACP synthase [Sulfobacillus thermosulfidooxidans]
MTTRAIVAGLGTYVPEKILTNQDLEQMVDTSDEWIVTRTGIKERHIAAPDETTSVMATRASIRALADAGITADDLDFIVCATNTPDTIFPSTAARVQHQLTTKPIPGVDIQAGCTGLIYGMEMASALIQSGAYHNILVIGADKLTSITDYEDRTTAVLFGDAAGAFVLQGKEGTQRGLLASYLQADGRGGDLLIEPAGGSMLPASEETVAARQHYLKMNGNETFRFAVKAMPEAVEEGLKKAGLAVSEMDLLVPHQANLRIIDAAVRRFELDPSRVVVNIDRYGNTSVATIPLALQEAREQGRVHDDDVVVLCAFGAGLTWGSNVIRWGR